MKIPNLYLLLLCLCCVSFCASAQTNFLPGYYVDDLGDSLHGFIEYRAHERMGEFIRFKKRINSRPRRLNPENIVLVSINDENFYYSFTYTQYNGEPFTGFFKKLVSGRITLYRYQDRYFVLKVGDKLREITKKKKMVTNTLIGDDYSGLGVVRSMISDCSAMDEQFLLNNYAGKYPDYRYMINTYNKCFPEGTKEIPDVVVKSHIDFGIQGALNNAQPDFSGTNNMSLAKFKSTTTVGGGVFLSLFTHQMGDRLRFNIEPSFGFYHGYSNFVNTDGVNDIFMKYKFVRMPMYFRYSLRGGFFVDLGLTNMIVLNQRNTWRVESDKYDDTYVFTSDGPSYKVKSGMFAAMAGLGGRFEVGGMPVFITVRASSIFRPIKDLTVTQPIVRWLDLGVTLQLTRK